MLRIKFSVLEIVLTIAFTLTLSAAIGMAIEVKKISIAMGVEHGIGRYMLREQAICEAASNRACVVRAIGVPVEAASGTSMSLLDWVDPTPVQSAGMEL